MHQTIIVFAEEKLHKLRIFFILELKEHAFKKWSLLISDPIQKINREIQDHKKKKKKKTEYVRFF